MYIGLLGYYYHDGYSQVLKRKIAQRVKVSNFRFICQMKCMNAEETRLVFF